MTAEVLRLSSSAPSRVGRIDLARTAPFLIGRLQVRPAAREVASLDGPGVVAEPRALQVLIALAQARGETVPRDVFVERCWHGVVVGEDALQRAIGKARRLAALTDPPAFTIESVPRVGYRLHPHGEASAAPPQNAEPAEAASGPAEHAERAEIAPPRRFPSAPVRSWRLRAGPTARRRMLQAVIGGAVALAAGAALMMRPGSPPTHVLLVRPIEAAASDDPAQSVANGLSSDLARMVANQASTLVVLDARDRSSAAADYVVTGAARTGDGRLHAGVKLLDAKSGEILWSRSFERAAAEPEALRDQIAARVADVAACVLARKPDSARLDVQTMRSFMAACEERHGDWTASAKLLAQVVERRPGFSGGWGMLAAATAASASLMPADVQGPQMRAAERYARRALQLDPRNPDAFFALAWAQPPGARSFPTRMALLAKGLSGDPSSDDVTMLSSTELAEVGRHGEALALTQRAVALSPDNQWALANLIESYGYYGRGTLVPALAALADRRWPGDRDLAETLFAYQALDGDPAAARALLDEAGRTFYVAPDRLRLWRALIRARSGGGKADVVRLLEEDLHSDDPARLIDDANDAAAVGRPDLAMKALDLIGNRRVPENEVVFRDYWAQVRSDPRFMAYAERQGLLQAWRVTRRWPDFCAASNRSNDCGRRTSRS